jgi:hypothetical protein
MEPIVGFESLYSITECGKVFSHRRDRFLKPQIVGRRYYAVTLYINGTWVYRKVHRLVAFAYIPNPNNYKQVNHKNGIKTDNRAENLEWCTSSQNIQHAVDTGLLKVSGEDCHLSRLKNKEVLKIRELHETGKFTQKDLGKKFNTCRRNISFIINRKSWKHL